ncbi:hypothetical protein PGTUg99_003843 [Puccinia graminis f. sp. tritici]|uniref:Uncharacterized protein n=1 Tax=Puccinia graminis f. sp. tritici TaxID=56615 RepID=A0A5B0QKZ9_PUCGR|nr:hypothetical protein PGTUg99_003843 [Puccinia graminis f. sp. tritici]
MSARNNTDFADLVPTTDPSKIIRAANAEHRRIIVLKASLSSSKSPIILLPLLPLRFSDKSALLYRPTLRSAQLADPRRLSSAPLDCRRLYYYPCREIRHHHLLYY